MWDPRSWLKRCEIQGTGNRVGRPKVLEAEYGRSYMYLQQNMLDPRYWLVATEVGDPRYWMQNVWDPICTGNRICVLQGTGTESVSSTYWQRICKIQGTGYKICEIQCFIAAKWEIQDTGNRRDVIQSSGYRICWDLRNCPIRTHEIQNIYRKRLSYRILTKHTVDIKDTY